MKTKAFPKLTQEQQLRAVSSSTEKRVVIVSPNAPPPENLRPVLRVKRMVRYKAV